MDEGAVENIYEPYRTEGADGLAWRGRAIRLAAIDIDDTLIGPDGVIGDANRAAVQALRSRGVRVVLASGRSHANMLRFHETLELGDGPVVSSQGALVRHTATGESWFQRAAAADAVAAVTREGLERGLGVLQYRLDGIYLQERTRWTDYDQTRNDELQVLVPSLLAWGTGQVLKVIWLGEPAEIAALAAEARAAHAGVLSVTETDPGYLEFGAAEVNKAAGLAVVAERLGVAPEEVVAFGDGNNDVAMLRWAGLGVAMAHARPAARDAADLVAPEGDPESSLARAVDLLLGPGADSARESMCGAGTLSSRERPGA